ncbi:hypothetical protein PAPYR_3491 [Paratrimastix pyriformis]|uniref:Uncharacterized protein n=1 Tax=Paratrimastix pyriformis TaxID=342808 RepID=A0ABQ8UPQ2_9EUKA|nr:hypothetical protein PAPYR_3491 [Paratrimastix pyriformis]
MELLPGAEGLVEDCLLSEVRHPGRHAGPPDWARIDPNAPVREEDIFLLAPLRYITRVGEHLLTIPHQLDRSGLGPQFLGHWLRRACSQTCALFLAQAGRLAGAPLPTSAAAPAAPADGALGSAAPTSRPASPSAGPGQGLSAYGRAQLLVDTGYLTNVLEHLAGPEGMPARGGRAAGRPLGPLEERLRAQIAAAGPAGGPQGAEAPDRTAATGPDSRFSLE